MRSEDDEKVAVAEGVALESVSGGMMRLGGAKVAGILSFRGEGVVGSWELSVGLGKDESSMKAMPQE